MSGPRDVSLCQLAFPMTTFEQDVAIAQKVGANGLSIDEGKLISGDDQAYVQMLEGAGLGAVICCPAQMGILFLPDRPVGPPDPNARIDLMCRSIERLAAFKPPVVFCLTGPAGDLGTSRAREIVVDGLRQMAVVANDVGVQLALEPMREERRAAWSMLVSMEETMQLIENVGDERMGIVYDTWHLWDSPKILESTRRFGNRIAGVQVCDYRTPRSSRDRMIPGEGEANIPALFAALEEGGYDGWYDLEIFSDELWQLPPEEFARRSVDGLRKTWQERLQYRTAPAADAGTGGV